MSKVIDLNKYAVFATPKPEQVITHNTKEDYEAIDSFNKSMAEVHRDYSAKEKLSCISAKKMVLTD